MEATGTKIGKELHDVIIDLTAGFYSLSVQTLKVNKGRFCTQEDAYKKHMCYYLIRFYTFMSYDQIGVIFEKDHSVIKFGYNKIDDLLTYNNRTITEVKEIKKLIDNFKANSNTPHNPN